MNTRPWPILLTPTDTNGYLNVLLNHQLLPTNVQYTWKDLHTLTGATISIVLSSKSIHILKMKNDTVITFLHHCSALNTVWAYVFKEDTTFIALVKLYISVIYLHSLQWFSWVMSALMVYLRRGVFEKQLIVSYLCMLAKSDPV